MVKESYSDRGCEYIVCGPDYNSMDDEKFGKYMMTDLKDILGIIIDCRAPRELVEKWINKLKDDLIARRVYHYGDK